MVSNATLHNEDEIIRKDIRLGDTVKVERAGDVIPHVVLVDLKKRKTSSKKFIFPNKCPCGFETIKEFNKVTKKYDAVRKKLGDGRIFLYMGRIANEKNIEALLRSWRKTKTYNCKLVIVGDGPIKQFFRVILPL